MKKKWIALALAAVLMAGGAAEAAQPGIADKADGIRMEEASKGPVTAKVPVFTEGTLLQRARINAAIEAEISRFYDDIEKKNEIFPATGWVSYDVGLVSEGCVSIVLYESIMPKGAAHPSTYVKGMTFDPHGNHIERADLLKHLPGTSADDVKAAIRTQSAEQKLFLFPEKDWSVHGWPKEFYVGADEHVYFIFQQYEIAPYAAGWISIRAM